MGVFINVRMKFVTQGNATLLCDQNLFLVMEQPSKHFTFASPLPNATFV